MDKLMDLLGSVLLPFKIPFLLIKAFGKKKALIIPPLFAFAIAGGYWILFALLHQFMRVYNGPDVNVNLVYNVSVLGYIMLIAAFAFVNLNNKVVKIVFACFILTMVLMPNTAFLETSAVGYFIVHLASIILILLTLMWVVLMITTMCFMDLFENLYEKEATTMEANLAEENQKEEEL